MAWAIEAIPVDETGYAEGAYGTAASRAGSIAVAPRIARRATRLRTHRLSFGPRMGCPGVRLWSWSYTIPKEALKPRMRGSPGCPFSGQAHGKATGDRIPDTSHEGDGYERRRLPPTK